MGCPASATTSTASWCVDAENLKTLSIQTIFFPHQTELKTRRESLLGQLATALEIKGDPLKYFSAKSDEEKAAADLVPSRNVQTTLKSWDATVYMYEGGGGYHHYPYSIEKHLVPVLKLMALINPQFAKLASFLSLDIFTDRPGAVTADPGEKLDKIRKLPGFPLVIGEYQEIAWSARNDHLFPTRYARLHEHQGAHQRAEPHRRRRGGHLRRPGRQGPAPRPQDLCHSHQLRAGQLNHTGVTSSSGDQQLTLSATFFFCSFFFCLQQKHTLSTHTHIFLLLLIK